MSKHVWALSLWQPWATLVALGAKKYETRGWTVAYRGPLLIHAAKRFTATERQYCYLPHFAEALAELGFHSPDELPRGCALGMVDLEAIYRAERIRPRLSERELAFGNFQDGRAAWKLANPRPLSQLVPLRGGQGLFAVQTRLIQPYLTGRVETLVRA